MLITQKQFVLSLILSTSGLFVPIHSQTLFDEMIVEMNEMQARFERRFNRINEEMKKGAYGVDPAIESPKLSIAENKNTNTIDVVIAPLSIKEKTFDATMDQDSNSLQLNTPAGTVTLQVDRHLLSVGFTHQIKHESDQKNGKQHIAMSSYNQAAKKVSAELALEESQIEYDSSSQKLTISIPLRKKTLTKIPVTVKENLRETANPNSKLDVK